MYAVFQNGAKQYKVRKDQIIRLEKLNAEIGKTLIFDKVLIIVNKQKITIGSPFIERAIVKVEVIKNSRDKKIKIIKFHRRKHYRKQQGHRQWFTDVKIIDINISFRE